MNNNTPLYRAFIKDLEKLGQSTYQLQIAKDNEDHRMAMSLIGNYKKIFEELLSNLDWLKDEVREWRYFYGCA